MKRPNIVYVFADQLRYDAVGFNHNNIISTPNLDCLAAEGVVFDNAYSSCPICSPYRAQVLSGLYAHQNGVVCNEYKLRTDIQTLPMLLGKHGYRSAYIGKWHLGYGPYTADKRYGFEYMAAYNINRDAFYGEYYKNEEGPIALEGWHPAAETDLAIDFIREHKKTDPESPFFLMMSWLPPHWPYETYPKEYNLYQPGDIAVPGNVPKAISEFERKEYAQYYGNVVGLDAQFGRLRTALEELGLMDNTIVCFTSDHGDHLGAHGYGKPSDQWLHHTKRASKATPYNEAIHLPFVIRYPGLRHGSRTDAFLSSVDIMPTLLSLCGINAPNGIAGNDLSYAAKGEPGSSPDSAYLQILGQGWPHRGPWVGFWRGVTNSRFTYARWLDNEVEPMLFDKQADPLEQCNLFGKPEYTLVQDEMEALLLHWMKLTDDPFEYGERDPKTNMLLLGQEFIHDKWKDDNNCKEN